MTFRRVDLGMVPALVARINYSGDLGYELWVAPEHQRALFDRIMAAGESHGLRLFGMRALMSLRLEKSYGTWFREYRPIYTPAEGGITRYIRLDHEFIGRAAHEAEMAAGGPKRRLVTLVVDPEPEDPADVIGDEPIWHDGKVVGWVTSGGYGHTVGSRSRSGTCRAGLADASDGPGVALRDRDHRPSAPGAAPARAAARPAGSPDAPVTDDAAAPIDRGRRRPDRHRRTADRVPARRLRGGRDHPGRQVAGARGPVSAWPATAATASPRSTASPMPGHARRPRGPGSWSDRHPRDGKPAFPIVPGSAGPGRRRSRRGRRRRSTGSRSSGSRSSSGGRSGV